MVKKYTLRSVFSNEMKVQNMPILNLLTQLV